MRKDGYVIVYAPGHPYACKNFVLEHRLVMEKAIGRYLEPHELVHHINEDKADNRLCNLEITNHADHAKHHFTGRRYPNRFRPRVAKDDLFRMYVTESRTLRECADAVGVSYGSIRTHCKFYGIEIRKTDPWHKKRRKSL